MIFLFVVFVARMTIRLYLIFSTTLAKQRHSFFRQYITKVTNVHWLPSTGQRILSEATYVVVHGRLGDARVRKMRQL